MIFQNRWHMYPQPLMHVRPSIFCLYVLAGESGKKKKTPGRKESQSKRYGYPFRAGGLSSNMSGLTFRFIYLGIDLEKDLCSLFHLSLSVVCRLIVLTGTVLRPSLFPVLSGRKHRSGYGDAPSPYEPKLNGLPMFHALCDISTFLAFHPPVRLFQIQTAVHCAAYRTA